MFNEKFWSRVRVGDDCWKWTGAVGSHGYGQFNVQSKKHLSHRLAFESLRGPIPEGLQIDHLCRVRTCVNPFHMEPVTQRENILRGDGPSAQWARATHCAQGHPYDEENTYVFPKRGHRSCRTCMREWNRDRRRRKAAIAVSSEVELRAALRTGEVFST